MRRLAKVVSLVAAVLLFIPGSLHAQELASIAGTVRDSSGGVLPGVTVEVTSPALIGAAPSRFPKELLPRR